MYTIKPLTNLNMIDLVYLYKYVFGKKVSLDFVRKKFDTTYLTEGYFGHIAYFKDAPVAFHGAIPVEMIYNNEVEIAAQFGDAMTLKEHAGNGLFTKLGKLTEIQLQKAGIKFVWGFPNQNSEYGYLNKLNWTYNERLLRFSFINHSFPLEKIFAINNKTKKIYKKYVKHVLKKYTTNSTVNNSILKELSVMSTHKTSAFYTYKSHADNFTIRIDDVLYWIKINNGLLVGDIEVLKNGNFDSSFKTLKNIAFNHGIRAIHFQSSPNTLIEQLIAPKAKAEPSWIVGYKNFNSKFPLEKLKLTFGDLDTF